MEGPESNRNWTPRIRPTNGWRSNRHHGIVSINVRRRLMLMFLCLIKKGIAWSRPGRRWPPLQARYWCCNTQDIQVNSPATCPRRCPGQGSKWWGARRAYRCQCRSRKLIIAATQSTSTHTDQDHQTDHEVVKSFNMEMRKSIPTCHMSDSSQIYMIAYLPSSKSCLIFNDISIMRGYPNGTFIRSVRAMTIRRITDIRFCRVHIQSDIITAFPRIIIVW
jgi:hypothetical protein